MAVINYIFPDSPTNNFATFNPLVGNGTPYDGNLKFAAQNVHSAVGTTMFVHSSSGKWYIEYYGTGWDNHPFIVFYTPEASSADIYTNTSTTNVWHWRGSGDWGTTGMASTSTGLPTWSSGDIVGVLIDYDNDGIFGFVNGSAVNSGNKLFSPSILDKKFGITIKAYNGTHYMNFGQDPTFGGTKTSGSADATDANGIGAFYYQPPTDALALCTANLPDFTPTVIDDVPQEYFKAVLYTGQNADSTFVDNGDGTWSKTGVGFQPDLIWAKSRSSATAHALADSVRGPRKILSSNNTDDEYSETSGATLLSFDSDGFTVGTDGNYTAFTANNSSIVAWCWKAGGAPDLTSSPTKPFAKNGVQYETLSAANITAGTITPTAMSVNTDAGFSIVKYTGNGSIPHGLSLPLDLLIVKVINLDGENWGVWHSSFSSGDYIYLHSPNQKFNNNSKFSGIPSSTVFQVGADSTTGNPAYNYIAYCWHSVEGFSKFGSYIGNGSPDGPFVYTGFRPAFVMVKWTSGGGLTTGSWRIMDTARNLNNPATLDLIANEAVSETTYGSDDLDILSNGFKWRSTGSFHNTSGANYIYMAFAEQPFKYSNAR